MKLSECILSDFFISNNELHNAVDSELGPIHVVGLSVFDKDALRNPPILKCFSDKLIFRVNYSNVDLITHISLQEVKRLEQVLRVDIVISRRVKNYGDEPGFIILRLGVVDVFHVELRGD